MSLGEWNKKEELVAEQALKHLRTYTPLFEAFTSTNRSEMALLLKVQEFCYENMNFMKAFQKIVLLFYKSEFICMLLRVTLKSNSTTYLLSLQLKWFPRTRSSSGSRRGTPTRVRCTSLSR